MIIVEADEVASDMRVYLQKVERGETIVIAVGNRPVAEMRPVSASDLTQRPFGLSAGDFVVPDDFDTPLPEETLTGFETR